MSQVKQQRLSDLRTLKRQVPPQREAEQGE